MKPLTLEDYLFIEFRLEYSCGLSSERSILLDPSRIEEKLSCPFERSSSGEDFPDDYAKAAVLATEFSDCPSGLSLRFGTVLGCIFLMANGYDLRANDDQIYEAAMNVASKLWYTVDLAQWYRTHAVKVQQQ
jgi:hypothetical protein